MYGMGRADRSTKETVSAASGSAKPGEKSVTPPGDRREGAENGHTMKAMDAPVAEQKRTVLVVEDEKNIRDLVCLHLEVEGLTCVPTADGTSALDLASKQHFDAVVLDLMLPGLDGISVCRAVRRSAVNRDVPILMLTARREESDKVLGLESGADDYLTKPFGVRELVARVRALLRRTAMASAAAPVDGQRPIQYKHIEVDPARHRVRVHGHDVELTTHEFNLLYVLLSHPGIVFSRDALLSRTWKENTFVTVRSVDTLVKRLRRKIEDDPANPGVILTVWGTGYKAADAD
jgi:DNA-binding response OmpR family regulator